MSDFVVSFGWKISHPLVTRAHESFSLPNKFRVTLVSNFSVSFGWKISHPLVTGAHELVSLPKILQFER